MVFARIVGEWQILCVGGVAAANKILTAFWGATARGSIRVHRKGVSGP